MTGGGPTRGKPSEPFEDEPYADGVLGRLQRFEWRHRKMLYPVLAIVGIGVAWLVDPGDLKWPISVLFVLASGYQAAKARASNDIEKREMDADQR